MVAPSTTGTALSEQNIPPELRRGHITFYQFIFKNKANRNYLIIAAVATIVQFVVFKILYPYADFFSDSYSYIYGAQENLDINIWPIGYSWFLRYIHFITTSDTVVVTIQYFLLIITSLLFFFTLRYFFNPARNSSNIIFAFIACNPLYLYISNYINSDPLFASLSLLWMTQLIWIIQHPQLIQILTHGILLYLCFIVRNNAMIYPFISALAFMLSPHKKLAKSLGIAFGTLLVILFVNHQRNAARKLIGREEFSLFTGWQLANNALYIYSHIDVDTTLFETNEAIELNKIASAYFKNAREGFDDFLTATTANHFIRDPKAPLKDYFKRNYSWNTEDELVKSWGMASTVFKDFGLSIIKNHPIEYIRFFMLRNAKTYFISPLEKLERYNLGKPEIWPIAVTWFKYPSNQAKARFYTQQGIILSAFPLLFLFLNISFILCITFCLFKKISINNLLSIRKILVLIVAFWIANMLFSLFSTMNVLRYQFFPMIILVAIVAMLIEFVTINNNYSPLPEAELQA